STTVLNTCAPGALVGGACWYLGAAGASCDATCSGLGLLYSDYTTTYAGSGAASFTPCNDVLAALGMPDIEYGDGTCGSGIGCFYQPAFDFGRVRCTSPASTSSAFDGDGTASRVCACI